MAFRVGQKVVCIDGRFTGEKEPFETYPVEGGIYTIRSICDYPDDTPGLQFEEIINPIWDGYIEGPCECDFNSAKFRPLVERKTDISIFTAMLNPSKQGEKV